MEERAFVLDPEEGSSSSATDGSEPKPGPLTIYDESQKVTGLLKADGRGEPQEFEYSYPEHYDIARVLDEANISFTTEPRHGSGSTKPGTSACKWPKGGISPIPT